MSLVHYRRRCDILPTRTAVNNTGEYLRRTSQVTFSAIGPRPRLLSVERRRKLPFGR